MIAATAQHSKARIAAVFSLYDVLRPLLFKIKDDISPKVFMDIGCGDGVLSFAMKNDIHPERAICIDTDIGQFRTELRGSFFRYQLDVCSDAFFETLSGTPDLVTCISAFHEFRDPNAAAANLTGVLAKGGALVLVDRTAEGWAREAALAGADGPEALAHYRQDQELLARTGFDQDERIRKFWEEEVFPELSGQGAFKHMGGAYLVLYRR